MDANPTNPPIANPVSLSFRLNPFETSPSVSKVFEALSKAQSEMKPAVMDMKNPHYNSRYASLTSCWEAGAPLFKHNLAVLQPVFWFDGAYYIRTILGHSPSGEWVASTLKLTLSKQDMQGLGSAITYAKRYALSAMVGIVDTEDDDGNQAVTNERKSNGNGERLFNPTIPAPQHRTRLTNHAPPPSPYNRLLGMVKEKAIPNEEMPGIILRATGEEKKAKDLTDNEADAVMKYINLSYN